MTIFKSTITALLMFFFYLGFITPAFSQQWTRVQTIPTVQITSLHANGDSLYATGPRKIYFTHDAGATWDSSAVLSPGLDDYITDVVKSGEKIYAGTINDGVFVSTDGGHTFQNSNLGLSGLGALSISMLAVRGDSLYATTVGAGIFVKRISTNGVWSSYSQGLAWSNIESIVNDNGTLIAGAGFNATLAMRAPGAATWTEMPFAMFNGEINAFLGVIRDGNTLLGAANQGFYRSQNNGQSWEHLSTGTGLISTARFVQYGSRTLAMLNRSSTFGYLFYTDNQGQSWQLFQPDPTGNNGFDIALSGDYLYSAHSNGLWRLQLTTDIPEEPLADQASFELIFPNPTTDQASLKFVLPETSSVTIALYDAQGRLIRTQNEGNLPVGAHTTKFSTTGLSAGMYHCALITVYGKQVKALSVAR